MGIRMQFRGVLILMFVVLCVFHFGVGQQVSSSSPATPGAGNQAGELNIQILIIEHELTLLCNGSEKATSVRWMKDGVAVPLDDRISVKDDNSLVIKKSKLDDVGLYTCRIEGPSPSEYKINVMTNAYIERFPKSVNLVEEETLSLHCRVKGRPTPTVEWFKDDVEIGLIPNNTRFKLKNDDKGVANAILSIENVQNPLDRGVYKCVASNAANNATTQTIVRVKDKLAALWPFLGIVAEVIILCTIIFIYEKRRGKNESEESDTDPGTDTKNMSDNNKSGEVRQRK